MGQRADKNSESQKGGRMGIRLWHAVNYHVTAGVMTSEAA